MSSARPRRERRRALSSGEAARDREAKCPFYRKSSGQRICCEGHFDGAYIQLIIPEKAMLEEQMRNYCAGRYAYCEIYRMVMAAKYESEG